MNRPSDMLRFNGGVADKVPFQFRMRGWKGSWPPPERMGMAVGRESGYVSTFDPDALPEGTTIEQVRAVAEVTVFRCASASQLPDDFDAPHVFRGADYYPEEDSHEGP